MLKPAAIPVTDGCGIAIFLLIDFLRGGLRRRTVPRRRVEDLRRRALASRQAFLLMPPACLIAHFGNLPRFVATMSNLPQLAVGYVSRQIYLYRDRWL